MYEMINSGNLHYDGFLAALNKGWRVAPIAGQDGHGTWRITNHVYRTGVLAPSPDPREHHAGHAREESLLHVGQEPRVIFSANGSVMGSVIASTESLSFRVSVFDPDAGDPKDQITRIEIVGDDGKAVSVEGLLRPLGSYERRSRARKQVVFREGLYRRQDRRADCLLGPHLDRNRHTNPRLCTVDEKRVAVRDRHPIQSATQFPPQPRFAEKIIFCVHAAQLWVSST